MKKIPTLFVRNPEDRRYVTSEVTPGCEWVLAGEGVATRKYDGTCVLRDSEGGWYARREVKHGKTPPPGWFEADCDPVTRKSVGWEPIGGSAFVKFFDEAVKDLSSFRVCTYELCGPKINGNPEQLMRHTLIPHALADTLPMSPRTFDGLRDWLGSVRYEGIVWHHPDGRMAKLKARDFPRTERDVAREMAVAALRAAAAEQRSEANNVPWDDEGTHADGHRCAADFIDRRADALAADDRTGQR